MTEFWGNQHKKYDQFENLHTLGKPVENHIGVLYKWYKLKRGQFAKTNM